MRTLIVIAALVLGAPRAAAQTSADEAPPTDDAPEAVSEPRAKAEERFYRGLRLFRDQLWDAALAEFLESRALYPTRAATRNAALSLRRLGRFDEALAMFETLVDEFPDMPEAERQHSRAELDELRALVGAIEIVAPPGTTVLVDGRERGVMPLPPLRVNAGSHVITLFREGFLPFSATIEVAGGRTARLEGTLWPLGISGRLHVREQRGEPAQVVIDGVVVGEAPWEGAVAVGAHSVALRGEGSLGSEPAAAPVQMGEITTVTLALERLEGELSIAPTPRDATVAIDGVALGRGGWRGRLKVGLHKVEVAAEGFVPVSREIRLEPGPVVNLEIELERDRTDVLWQAAHQPRIVIDLHLGAALAPTLNGEVTSAGCGADCSSTVAYGVNAMLHGGYQFGSGLGLFLAAGYFQAEAHSEGRATTLKERPDALRQLAGTVDDVVLLRGVLLGAAGAYHFGETWTWTLRLGAGALIGMASDSRSGRFGPLSHGALREAEAARLFYAGPEIRAGYRLHERAEISLGLSGVLLLPLESIRWRNDRDVVTSELIGFYDEESLVGPTFFLIPGLGGRVDF
jgi:hypothetical protein